MKLKFNQEKFQNVFVHFSLVVTVIIFRSSFNMILVFTLVFLFSLGSQCDESNTSVSDTILS